jgi:hypothetical protein
VGGESKYLSGVSIVEAEHGGVERAAVHHAEYPCCMHPPVPVRSRHGVPKFVRDGEYRGASSRTALMHAPTQPLCARPDESSDVASLRKRQGETREALRAIDGVEEACVRQCRVLFPSPQHRLRGRTSSGNSVLAAASLSYLRLLGGEAMRLAHWHQATHLHSEQVAVERRGARVFQRRRHFQPQLSVHSLVAWVSICCHLGSA